MSDQMQTGVPWQSNRRQLPVRFITVLLSGILLVAGPVRSERTYVRAAEPAASVPASEVDEKPVAANNRPTERQVKAYIGLAALAGIVIAGVGLGALIILWAGRLRRQLRKPMPECHVPERDFWFLKPPKPMVKDSSLSDSHLPPHDAPPSAEV